MLSFIVCWPEYKQKTLIVSSLSGDFSSCWSPQLALIVVDSVWCHMCVLIGAWHNYRLAIYKTIGLEMKLAISMNMRMPSNSTEVFRSIQEYPGVSRSIQEHPGICKSIHEVTVRQRQCSEKWVCCIMQFLTRSVAANWSEADLLVIVMPLLNFWLSFGSGLLACD